MPINILKESVVTSKKKVRIEGINDNEIDFLTMRNGFQWSGMPVDDELLRMMKDAIIEYFDKKN